MWVPLESRRRRTRSETGARIRRTGVPGVGLEHIEARLIEIGRCHVLVIDVEVDFADKSIGPLAGEPRPLRATLLAIVNHESLDHNVAENGGTIGRRIQPENGIRKGA